MIKAVPHIAALPGQDVLPPEGDDVISLTQTHGGFAASPLALKAGQEALGAATRPADPDWQDLRRAISRVHGVPDEQILCGSGIVEMTGALIEAYVDTDEGVIGGEFGDPALALACARNKCQFSAAVELEYAISVENIVKLVTPTTRMVVIGNPGPVTGTLIANSKLIELRRELRKDILLVITQAYGEFADVAQNRTDLFSLVGAGNTAILRDFSGAYGLSGAQVGWGLFPADIAVEIRKLLYRGLVTAVSQAMACAALEDQPHLNRNVQQIGDIRDDFAADMRRLGVLVPPSYADAILLRFDSEQVAQSVNEMLRAQGFVMRPLEIDGLRHCLRATMADRDVMTKVLEIMGKASS